MTKITINRRGCKDPLTPETVEAIGRLLLAAANKISKERYMVIYFRCKGCGLVNAKASVRARSPNEDLGDWLEDVKGAVGRAHRFLKPGCPSKVCDVVMPMDKDAEYVGQKPKAELPPPSAEVYEREG